ncbi:MAG: cytochrome c [Burkholderiaceae bacterium]|nr:MAG: cytochrome c [Burkholderiaceae bacterium]
MSGTAVDGYLKGATVFLDVNGNGSFDAGEPSALTDDSGRYVLDTSSVGASISGMRVIATGGIDTDTGYAFTGKLAARADSATTGQLISPLTSLVDALVGQGMTADAARARVAQVLGLNVGDLASDPVAAIASQPVIYTSQVALQRAVQLVASADVQASESAHDAQERIYRALAQVVVAQNTPATVGELVAKMSAKQSAAGRELADAIESAVDVALRSPGGHASAKATLQAMDQVRNEMENGQDYNLAQAASRLDSLKQVAAYRKLTDKSNKAGQSEAVSTVTRTSGSTTALTQPASSKGRLLASNCFQCHGTGGVGGFDKIRGGDAGEVKEFLSKPARGGIMAAHAQGYTSAQLDLIIAYLKQ